MKFLFIAILLVFNIITTLEINAAVGQLDQFGNAWNNVTTSATCVTSDEIYVGNYAEVISLYAQYNYVSGPTPTPEVFISFDKVNWISLGNSMGGGNISGGVINFYGALRNAVQSAPWIRFQFCAAVSGLTISVFETK